MFIKNEQKLTLKRSDLFTDTLKCFFSVINLFRNTLCCFLCESKAINNLNNIYLFHFILCPYETIHYPKLISHAYVRNAIFAVVRNVIFAVVRNAIPYDVLRANIQTPLFPPKIPTISDVPRGVHALRNFAAIWGVKYY